MKHLYRKWIGNDLKVLFNPLQVRLGVTFREPLSSACGRKSKGIAARESLNQGLDYQTLLVLSLTRQSDWGVTG